MLKLNSFPGKVDLDYRRDERDARYKVLDLNPRVGQLPHVRAIMRNWMFCESFAGI